MEQNPQNHALLVMDMQSAILSMLPNAKEFVGNVAKAIAIARHKKIPVIYVVVGFRQGTPEINLNNKGFAAAKERFAKADMNAFTKIEPSLAPLANEIVVTKRRVCAFSGSDLEIILKTFNIQHLILSGIATSGVVLSTVREAADKDYRLTVISDCCADGDEEVHRVLTTKIFPRQADVLTLEEWSSV
ncbi:MAG TPA: isochorismatase family cysteine hydrolase [Puia sp.]|nr:isochorismatase family cysteine hydrolase [Puia sp.]